MNLIATGTQRAGKASRIEIGVANLAFASWSVDLKGDDLETVNFESYDLATGNSYGEGILGVLSADVRMGGDWDASQNPLDDPPGLYPRDDLQSVNFVDNRVDATEWTFAYMRIRSATNGTDVKGKVTFSASGHNQGTFSFPSGSV